MAAVKAKWTAFDKRIADGPVEDVKKKLRRCNIFVGAMMVALAGVLGGVMAVLPIPSFSKIICCLYCFQMGIFMTVFELSNSPKTQNFFRVNLGFYMTYSGRAFFLIFIAFFAMSGGATGILVGIFAFFDALFHIYCRSRNAALKADIKTTDAERLDGSYVDTNSGIITSFANKAVEDPNAAYQQSKATAKFANDNKGAISAASGGGMGGMVAMGGLAAASGGMAAAAPPPPSAAPPAARTSSAGAGGTSDSLYDTGSFVEDDYTLGGDDDGTAI